jgi:hypothetical protein
MSRPLDRGSIATIASSDLRSAAAAAAPSPRAPSASADHTDTCINQPGGKPRDIADIESWKAEQATQLQPP